MKRFSILLLLLLLALPGCDVAAVALLMSSQDKGSDDDDPLTAPSPGFGSPIFKAWIGMIPDAPAADQERLNLIAADGNPSATTWTEIGNAAATFIFDPSADPATFNAILIQISSDQNYLLDCVEILDASQNTVLDHASGATYSNLMNQPDQILGPPDGLATESQAVGTTRAFIFSTYTTPIPRFRINLKAENQAASPGDVTAVGTYQSFLSERPGGLAIDSAGLIHLTMSLGDTGRLERYDLTGTRVGTGVEISTDLATAGIHSVALNSAGEIFTSCSNGTGVIQVRSFATDLTPSNAIGLSSGFNGDRVEHNSIAIDGSGNVVVVGGFSSLLSGRNHFRAKMPPTLAGSTWSSSASLDSSSTTYWHAVTTGANDDVFMAGDLLSSLLGGTTQIYTGQFSSAGVGTWDDTFAPGEQPADIGHAIQLDSAGNIYIGGSVGKASGGRDGVIVRYTPGGASVDSAEFAPLSNTGDDEILDIAIDSDGSIYAVGFETVAGQGENWWVRKLNYDATTGDFIPGWLRTHHGGFGNDRAVGVAIYDTQIVVAGYETNGSAQTKLVLRIYEK